MNPRYNVMVWPGGTEIGLEIQRALSPCKEIRLFSGGIDAPSHAPYVFAHHFTVPGVQEAGWLDTLNAVLPSRRIDYIFPAHDDVITALARSAGQVQARVVSSPPDTCLIARSKSRTYRTLGDLLPVPRQYRSPEEIDRFPVFVKPDAGQGSQDTHLVSNSEQLVSLLQEGSRYIVTEYLPGPEYTVDCFSDREAGLLFVGGRQRIRTRQGISMNSRPARDYETLFAEYAAAICRKLPFHGAWFFQVKQDRQGTFKLLEIAPRIAGTMALHRVQGINFPLLSLYEQERIPITILQNAVEVEVDRALTNRYRHNVRFGAVYVDLDDTLILHGGVNTPLVRFLYQCVNAQIPICLLTRHAGCVEETLRKHRLTGLFDEVIEVPQPARKSDYIRYREAILIDDSFRERKEVHERLGILTFDGSMIEMLLDERA